MNTLENFVGKYWPWLIGAVVLYYAAKRLPQLAQNAVEPIGTAIANAYLGVTLPGDVNVTAAIVLPDGSTISANSIYLNDKMQFTYNGITYTLTGRDANNNYVAVRA